MCFTEGACEIFSLCVECLHFADFQCVHLFGGGIFRSVFHLVPHRRLMKTRMKRDFCVHRRQPARISAAAPVKGERTRNNFPFLFHFTLFVFRQI